MNRDKNLAIGKKIRDALISNQQSVKKLSENTGISVSTLYSIMNGHQSPSLDKIELIANALQISIDSILNIEVTSIPIFPNEFRESMNYAMFENRWFGQDGGERISVSRNFSTANQSPELRREILKNVYLTPDEKLEDAVEAFKKRLDIIGKKEINRLEIVVHSEISDFVLQREPWNTINPSLIRQCVEGIIEKLENSPLKYEIIIIPRQFFLVNYEIIKRQVILFDLGSVYYRQNHPDMVKHFLQEVEYFKYKRAVYSSRKDVIQFLSNLLKQKE